MLLTNNDDAALLTIAGRLDISVAEELRDALRDHLGRHPEPTIALSDVESCDAAVLQLLWSAQRTATRTGKCLRVTAWSGAIEEAAGRLGLELRELGKDTASGL